MPEIPTKEGVVRATTPGLLAAWLTPGTVCVVGRPRRRGGGEEKERRGRQSPRRRRWYKSHVGDRLTSSRAPNKKIFTREREEKGRGKQNKEEE